MRKFILSAALLASTVAVAAPASAQWAPPAPNGNAYGYNNNYGQVRRLQARVQHVRNEIRQLDRRNILSEREARRLDQDAREIQYRIQRLGNNGINNRERYEIERRVDRLERNVQREARDYNRYDNRGGRDGWNDRDRDGRNDRYENDRGYHRN